MTEAGMSVYTDAVGNICGRLDCADEGAPLLLIGSHLDSVPDAGRYDGVLGVLLGIAVVEQLPASTLPFNIEVIGFGEEEGVRFGTTLMTSRACAGTWDNNWLQLADVDGVTVADALTAFGLDAGNIATAARTNTRLVGFLEAHIEQGPVLESLNLPLAVVSNIAGAKRLQLAITGMAAHAGTMPMHLRRDALSGAAQVIAAVEQVANANNVIATVGHIVNSPNAVNVVPGQVQLSIDIRAGDDSQRDVALDAILGAAQSTCSQRGLQLAVTELHSAPAVACTSVMQQAVADGIAATGVHIHHMDSGAGHDAMAMAAMCPTGMLFVRCTGGISHHPDEAVSATDVSYALTALRSSVMALAKTH